MKTVVTAACTLALATAAIAFERNMLNLDVPTAVEPGNGVVDIRHRFYGPVDDDPLGTFLGMTDGADVGLGFRYVMWSRLEVEPTFTFFQREYTVGVNYAYDVARLFTVGGNVEFFSYDLDVAEIEERRQNFFYALELQGEPIFGVVSPVVNVAFDGYEERAGAGFGVALGLDRDGLIKHIALLGEYYPVLQEEEGRTGTENSFAYGVELQTYGHHFAFLVGNNSQIGTRHLMQGAPSNRLYFGFNINRRIEF